MATNQSTGFGGPKIVRYSVVRWYGKHWTIRYTAYCGGNSIGQTATKWGAKSLIKKHRKSTTEKARPANTVYEKVYDDTPDYL